MTQPNTKVIRRKEPTFKAKCIACKKSKTLSMQDVQTARELGMAMCACGSPMVITKVST